jgi:polysaccharide export outer membrane protein
VLKQFVLHSREAVVAAALLVSACATPPVGQDPQVTVVNTPELPAPASDVLSASRLGGGLAPGDVVTMKIYGTDDFNSDAQVSADGTLEFPFTGPIQAAGMTIPQLREAIAARLSPRYIRDPQVILTTQAGPARQITVGGQVNKPGFVSTDSAPTLLRAVVGAGGTTEFAKRNEAIIIRQVGPDRYLGLYDLAAIERGNYPDPKVYPGDIVMIGENRFWFIVSRALNISQVVTAPIIAIDRVATH